MDQWSKTEVEQTRKAFRELSFVSRTGRIWVKHIDGRFGFVRDEDAFNGRYTVHLPESDQSFEFHSIDELIAAGWILD